jgi:hypothetical protein
MEQWTATAADFLDIKGIRNVATVEADDLELENAGPNSYSDSDSADGAEYIHVFFLFLIFLMSATVSAPHYSKR